MSVKERLVEIIRAEGYDFMSACEHATRCINEFLASGRPMQTFVIGQTSFTLNNRRK